MKVILYMATSLNGYIADSEGKEDFFIPGMWQGFVDLLKETKSFIYGRKTYEEVLGWGEEYSKSLAQYHKVVLSKDGHYQVKSGYEVANTPSQAIEIMRKHNLPSTLVTGGATTNTAFIQAGLIDEVIFNIDPTLLGKGVPVCYPADFITKLELISATPWHKHQIVKLRYKVIR